MRYDRNMHTRRVARRRHSPRRLALLAAAALAATACAGATTTAGAPDATVAARLEEATRPERRIQVTFDWSLNDRDANFSGRGVLRLDGAQRARVDLFGPRGETYAAAILQGNELRAVPPAAASMLPPPPLLWASLGVFRQPGEPLLSGTSVNDGVTLLEYASQRLTWRFRFENDRLRSTEWTDGAGRRTVELTGSAEHGLPRQGVFRDWTQFRELTLSLTDVEDITTFEDDVWILPGER
jgi:hypothetical protein